jgi:hypothetical protein
MWRCATGGPLPYKASAPDQGVDWIGFPIPEIFPKGKEITFLTHLTFKHLLYDSDTKHKERQCSH